MPGRPAKRLMKFAKECKDKKLRSFSSYKTKKELDEVLEKYGIISGDITHIPQFIPHKIKIMGPVIDSNKAIWCEYISTILHMAVSILGDLVITSQANIIEDTLKDDTELCKNVKRVLEIIVGLLKDRAVGSENLSATKKHHSAPVPAGPRVPIIEPIFVELFVVSEPTFFEVLPDDSYEPDFGRKIPILPDESYESDFGRKLFVGIEPTGAMPKPLTT
ncbi:hypothetical protein C1645_818773 [Glomus cerebriforme]|uniref:Uncharacterized protein n=1 Tax=Glomus cerebriforme TaxID=658196 RepID=A0A397TAE0_9GLOM|nr:hypothetical protein C1645_818773 [Glomus cerebriforme]